MGALTSLLAPWAFALVLAYMCYVALSQKPNTATALDLLPWVGSPKGRLARLRAKLSPESAKAWMEEGFEKYTRKGERFVFQSFMGNPIIVLPRSQVPWINEQPDSVLSFKKSVVDNLSLDITALDPLLAENPLHHLVVKDLTKALGTTPRLVMDELREAFNTEWGTSTHWTKQVVWESTTKIFAQVTGRVFVGTPLCRNKHFLENIVSFAEDIITSGTIIRPSPRFLRPVLGWIFTRSNRKHFNEVLKDIAPIIEQRKLDLQKYAHDPDLKANEPSDLLQWALHVAYDAPDPHERETIMIAKRFAIVCFAAIHTTAVTSTNLLFDILSAGPETMRQLREEIHQVIDEEGPEWTKQGVAKLVRLDSAVRESQRLHSVSVWGVQRTVFPRDGISLHDGLHVPDGVDLAVPAFCIHRDEDLYASASSFDPFRFSRPREEIAATNLATHADAEERKASILKSRNLAAVSTGDTQFSFGGGRHACPGRFFAVQEVKLMVVYALMEYEIMGLETRPENPWVRDLLTPNVKAEIEVRKI